MTPENANEFRLLVTTGRHVKEMDTNIGAWAHNTDKEGCALCEAVRRGIYSEVEGTRLDNSQGFSEHFGCTAGEAYKFLFHGHTKCGGNQQTNGENYYQAGMELLTKYGYNTEASTQSFAEIMSELTGVEA